MWKEFPVNSKARIRMILFCALVILLGVAVILNFSSVSSFFSKIYSALSPVLVGCAFAYLMIPVESGIETFLKKTVARKGKHPDLTRGIASLVSVLLLAVIIVAFFFLLIPRLVESIESIVVYSGRFYNQYYADINAWLIEKGIISEGSDALTFIWGNLNTEIKSIAQFLMDNILTVSNIVYSLVYNIFVGLVAMFYLLYSKEKICRASKKLTFAFFSNQRADLIVRWTHKSNDLFAGFIRGKLIDSVIIGIITFFATCLINADYAMLIAIIVTVTNVIPFFGPFIGAVPSILILLMIDPMDALWFAIAILIIQQLDGNVIGPYILGDRIGISPLWIMVSILIGGKLAGVVGMLLGVPVFALAYSIVKAISEVKLEQKSLPTDVAVYGTDFKAPDAPAAPVDTVNQK